MQYNLRLMQLQVRRWLVHPLLVERKTVSRLDDMNSIQTVVKTHTRQVTAEATYIIHATNDDACAITAVGSRVDAPLLTSFTVT